MAFVRLENVLPTLLLCAVITTRLKPTSSQRTTTIKFAAIPDPINVLKNETVEFNCKQNSQDPFNIKFNGYIVIVENTEIKEEFSNIFDFQVFNLTTGKLTLKHATEEYKGTFKCIQGMQEKYVVISNVYTLISGQTICKSSIEIGQYIFEDQIDLIEMNCTSEEGIPHVTMSNHIIQGNKTTDVTSISTKTTSSHPHPSKTLSFSPHFTSSFNNSVFVCNVSQQLPEPYKSYQGSCSLAPILLLPLFSVAVTPSEIIFSKVKNNIIKCTSDVSEVNLTWANIPSHWKYNISEGDANIELNVKDTGSDVDSVNIQCVGNYRNRNITSTIQISATNNQGRVIAVILVVIFICSCFVCVIIIAARKYHLNVPKCNRKSLSRMTVQARENASTNNANDRNYSINDDAVSPIVSQTDNDYALNVPGTEVSYGDITTMDYNEINEINDSGPDITVPLVITAISLCLIFIMIVIVVLYFRLNVSFLNRNPDLAKQNSSTNNANVRNTTNTDDVVSSMRFQTENSALDVPAMIDNTIYQTYTEKDCQNQTLSETERLEKEQEIEMVENEIYESNSFSGYG